MNEWIRASFIESKAMVVVFLFLQTLSALSRDYYGPTSMVGTLYITSSVMEAEGVLTCCEGDILWRSRDLYRGSIKVTNLQRVKLISLLIEANVNDCECCPVHDMSNIFLLDSKIYVWPPQVYMLYDNLERAETDVLCSCFLPNCSSFICCVFTEEPWQRQFTVTCRETDIKILLILFLIIPTWNIWNKTAM